ncbi:MAG: 6-bladed beta-propeller [Balneolaceae bacterium]
MGNNLQLLFSFGQEGEVVLMAPWDITSDKEQSIFLSEHLYHTVHEFTLEGEFRRIIGREGSGPGEFRNPQQLTIDGEWLYVQDIGNMRLVLFHLDSDRTEIIVQDRSFSTFRVYDDRIYGFFPGSYSVDGGTD